MACLLNIPQCLIYAVPWWVWLALGLVVVGVILKLFGWRWAVAMASAVGAAVLLDRARQQGYQDRKAQEQDAAKRADTIVKTEQDRAKSLPDDKLNAEVDKWTRK